MDENWRCRATVTVPQAAEILSLSRNTGYAMASDGTLPTLRFGRRVVVPVAGLRKMLGEAEGQSDSGGDRESPLPAA